MTLKPGNEAFLQNGREDHWLDESVYGRLSRLHVHFI